eukprot:5778095-Ditylum_brightwellii.AAC.1
MFKCPQTKNILKSASAVTSMRLSPELASIAQIKNVYYKYFQKWSKNNCSSTSVEAAEGQDDGVDIADDQDLEMMCEG